MIQRGGTVGGVPIPTQGNRAPLLMFKDFGSNGCHIGHVEIAPHQLLAVSGPLDVKKGDKVLFAKYGGTEIKIDGEELLVMREEDIMGVVEG